MRRLLDAVLVLLVVLGGILSACSRSNGSITGDPELSTTVPPEAAAARFPDDRIVWQAEYLDDTLSDVARAAARPSVTIYGDGRIFLTDPGRDPRYDQPLSLRHGTIERDVLATFLAEAEATGLLDEGTDFGEVEAEDTTAILLRTHGLDGPREVRVRSLGGRFDPLVGEAQAERRERLRKLLSAGEALLEDPSSHDPERVRVLVLPDDAGYEPIPEAVDEDEEHPWPGAEPEATGCDEVAGSDASELLAAAIENPTPLWDIDGRQRVIVVVDLLPGEVACS